MWRPASSARRSCINAGYHLAVPTRPRIEQFLRMNEAARAVDEAADRARTMSERLALAAELSRAATSLHDSARRAGDAGD
jgi:hypothetical protein